MPAMAGAIATLMLAGVAQSLCMVSHTVILLRAANERLRGRVMGVRMMAIYSLPLGLLAAGALIERIGFDATVMLYALTGAVCTILIAWRWRKFLWRQAAGEHLHKS
jgi:hypothetical protein